MASTTQTLPPLVPKAVLAKLREDEMAKGLCAPFDAQAYREVQLAPRLISAARLTSPNCWAASPTCARRHARSQQMCIPSRPLRFRVQATIDPLYCGPIPFARCAYYDNLRFLNSRKAMPGIAVWGVTCQIREGTADAEDASM
jgi:hypothetical protein